MKNWLRDFTRIHHIIGKMYLYFFVVTFSFLEIPTACFGSGIWIDTETIRNLPISGLAWNNLKEWADRPLGTPNLSDQENSVNIQVLAKAYAYVRLNQEKYAKDVIKGCTMAIDTEKGGRVISLAKRLAAYVIAADLVGLPNDVDQKFRSWLNRCLKDKFPSGKTLRSTHQIRPNNWGTFAGASRLAIASYLDDDEEIVNSARVFKGWLGDRNTYSGFEYKDLSWQFDLKQPVGINPKGATKLRPDIPQHYFSIDGVLPDDQRRGGSLLYPPPKENYVYSALQGAVVQAVILHRAGYDVWNWEDKALLRAFQWLYNVANYPAQGDDIWLIYLINHYYGEKFSTDSSVKPGKNMAWTDWTHSN